MLFLTASCGDGFHQRNVLVGGGMKDDGRSFMEKDFLHAAPVFYVADKGGRGAAMLADKFLLDFKNAVFALPDNNQTSRIEAADLAAQFRADRATRARHQNALPRNIARDTIQVGANRRAAQ